MDTHLTHHHAPPTPAVAGDGAGDGVVQIPLGLLLPADSPRMSGENLQHARTLMALDDGWPPILVHRPTMRVIDGMHRLRAAILRQQPLVEVEFFDGTPEDAFVRAVSANIGHGLPLTLAERTAAAARIIISHPHWSDRAVAAACGLAAKTVGALRRRGAPDPDQPPGPPARLGQDGRIRPLSSAEGRRLAGRLINDTPDASLREVARQAGISPGTVRDVRARLARGEDPVPAGLRTPAPAPAAPAGPGAAGTPGTPAPAAEPGPARPADGTAPHTPAPAHPAEAAGLENLFRALCRDPALRQSESGRLMLRALELHLPAQWRRITGSVPHHRAALAAAAAQECAKAWQEFAAHLQRIPLS
ncbi:ParB/RepB/Spo0J family partition protein [Streptomyces purpureus]|uniref:ParB/RepB/Spo0J family partition protein n=1 Tax=Streptomyces purpureus TaxID=1951 RepID=UPI0037981256